jgi:hypothetical protein
MDRIFNLFAIVAIILSTVCVTVAADRYVAQAGQTPAGGYTTWETAATNIQHAVDAAAANETVWISNGVYSVGLSNTIVYIKKGLRLRGFSGSRGDVILEGPATKEPTRATRGVYIQSTNSEYILVDSLTISNCTAADFGAGMYITGSATYPGTTEVRNCSILNCSNRFGSIGGGSIYSSQSAGSGYHTILTNCTIANNWSTNRNFCGGYFVNGKGTIDDCLFAANGISPGTDRGFGFGMFATGTVRNCRFERHIQGGSWGMAFSCSKDVLVENCAFVSNTGPNSASIFIESTSNVVVRNCLFSHNAAGAQGGAFYLTSSRVTIENCTIVSNKSGLYLRNSGSITGAVVLVNNIICSNNANFDAIVNYLYATNNCSSTALGAYGPGNITASPQFVDYPNGDFRLSPTSPCINAGFNLPWMDGFRDLDDRTRKDIFSGVVDMGCYEYLPRGVMFKVR